MNRLLIVLVLSSLWSLRAQTPSDILSQIAGSAEITFPTISALGQDAYDGFSRTMAVSHLGLSSNKDSSGFFISGSVQGTRLVQSNFWEQDILNGTSITIQPGFSHISSQGQESLVTFTMIDPLSGLPSINPLTGGPIIIETSINTGFGITEIPFGSIGLGYKYRNFHIEGSYLPLGLLSSLSPIPSIGISNSHIGRLTLGGHGKITQKLHLNFQGSLHSMGINLTLEGDTITQIAEEGQIFTLVNDMDRMVINNRLITANMGLSIQVFKRASVEIGGYYYNSKVNLNQEGPLLIYLQTNNPIDGTAVTAGDELRDILDGQLTSQGLHPYISCRFATKKHSYALTLSAHTVSILFTL